MAEFRVLNTKTGLSVNGNPYTLEPSTLIKGENIECVREGVYRKNRGRAAYGTGLPSANFNQILEYKSRVLVHMSDNSLYYDSDGLGTFVKYLDILGADKVYTPESGYKIASLESQGNLYITSSLGIQKIDSLTAAFRNAGCPKGLPFDIILLDSVNWLTAAYTTAYRILWSYTDANNNKIFGEPSERQEITNGTATAKATSLRIYIPSDITTSHYLEIYRSTMVSGTPAEDMQLVYQAKPTSGEISAGYMSVNDIMPDGFRGAYLYTNTTQEGLEQANARPPKANTFDKFRDFVFYGDIESIHRLYTSLISITNITTSSTIKIDNGTTSKTLTCFAAVAVSATANNGAGLVRITTGAAHNIITDDYVRISGIIGTIEANGIWKVTKIDATNFDLQASTYTNAYVSGGRVGKHESVGIFTKYDIAGDSDSIKIMLTSQSLIRAINLVSGSLWYAYYNSNVSDPPGKILITGKNVGEAAFYLTANSTATGNCFSPNIPTSGTTYVSTNDNFANAIMWCKIGQTEHVPYANIKRVGTADDKVIKVVGLRDALIIIKANDGIFMLTGESPANFVVTELDGTCECLQKNSIAKGDNAIFMMSGSGYVKISSVGVEIIGKPIDFKIKKPTLNANFETTGYGWYYSTEDSYYITTFKETTSTTNDVVYLYNVLTDAWLVRKHGVYSNDTQISVARVINDIMYSCPITGNGILKERKSFTTTDLASPNIDVTVIGIDTTLNEIELSAAITIPDEALFTQGTIVRHISEIVSTTVIKLLSVKNLALGAAVIIPGIESKIKYQKFQAGMPEYDKHFQKLSLFFDDDETAVGNLSILTSTDIETTEIETKLVDSINGAWGKDPWGKIWGQYTLTNKWLTLVPDDHARASELRLEIVHTRPREQIALCGYSVILEVVDTRYQI